LLTFLSTKGSRPVAQPYRAYPFLR
jgi:hypothetical protein